MNKFFPIKTETACQLKWTWSTIHLWEGTTCSCHRVGTTLIDLDDFDNFHNTPKKLSDRQLMLEGKWPTGGCEYCGNIEKAGGSSDRMMQLQIPNLTPPELEKNPTAIKVTPRIVEVYLDNVCNMSCIYCWNYFSSRIHAENQKFGRFEQNNVVIDNIAKKTENFEAMSDKFWQWMSTHYPDLRRLHVLGGEPFFQSQFETCLEFLESNCNNELEFNIISNLKVPPARLENFIQRIKKLIVDKKIKRFDLTCSIDCWDDEQEYIRYGIDMADWRKNFEYLVNQPWIVLNINQTITGLSIKSTPQLIEYINQHRQFRKIGHYFMSCKKPTQLNPDIFGSGFFDLDFERILTVMPNDTWQHKQAQNYMKGIQLEINTHARNNTKLQELKTLLNEIDRRRNLDWRKTFPWLVKELDHVV